jgi:phospholipase/carboxylesterase
MSQNAEDLLDVIAALVTPLLYGLDTIAHVARNFHPSRLDAIGPAIGHSDAELAAALERFQTVYWPDNLASFRDQLEQSAGLALSVFEGLRAAATSPDGAWEVFRALRRLPRAAEALYPVATALPILSKFFLEPASRNDTALIRRLAEAEHDRPDTGVIHFTNAFSDRGGFSLYVPEYLDPDTAYPLVIALHGGSGHGRSFLWSWVREARTRGLIVLAPTAIAETWSLMAEDVDRANIERMLEFIEKSWKIDPQKRLLTGMSDGGTFSLLAGLHEASPFTHLAPFAPSFHPMLIAMTEPQRLAGLPIYLVHGALDWMFPVAMAREAAELLGRAGAKVKYREISDLAHTYPRDENSALLDWFLA